MTAKISSFEKWVYSGLALLVFTYIAIRTVTVGLANDEAATFFTFVHTSDFIPFVADYISANNHLVNTALTWFTYHLFGVSEWAIRLPNLLALAVFLWYSFKIGRLLNSVPLRWFFWIALLSAHFLIEFFGYCRGYGISIGFLMGALYHLFRSSHEQKPLKQLIVSLSFLTVALLANLNFLIVFMIWLGLANLILLQRFKWKSFFSINFLAALPLTLAVLISLKLKDQSELYLGQQSLLQSVKTLVVRFTRMDRGNETGLYLALGFIGFILVLGFTTIVRQVRMKKRTLTPAIIFVLTLGLSFLASQLLFGLMGILFPTERTGMHWYLLLVGSAAFLSDELKGRLKPVAALVLLGVFSPVILFGIRSVNLRVSSDPWWALEQIPDEFYWAVADDKLTPHSRGSISSSTSLNTYTWAFKNLKFGEHLNGCHDFYFKNRQYVADYLILNQKEFDTYSTLYDTLRYDPYSKMSLLKRKIILEKRSFLTQETGSPQATSQEWSILAEARIKDSLQQRPFRADYELLLHSDAKPLVGLVTLEFRDSANTTLHYDQFRIDFFKTHFTNDQPIRSSIVLDSIPQKTQTIRTLFWNIKSEPFTLNSSRVDFYELVEN